VTAWMRSSRSSISGIVAPTLGESLGT
jgi:hypothetical protein